MTFAGIIHRTQPMKFCLQSHIQEEYLKTNLLNWYDELSYSLLGILTETAADGLIIFLAIL